MAVPHKTTTNGSEHAHVAQAAENLLNEGKKLANELYHDGLEKLNLAEKDLKAQTDEILEKVRKKPLQAVLIAGGIGFLLSTLLRK